MVEKWDDYFLDHETVTPKSSAKINSETLRGLLDRMSILLLKIYHMKEQTERKDASPEHIAKWGAKLDVLLSSAATCSLRLIS